MESAFAQEVSEVQQYFSVELNWGLSDAQVQVNRELHGRNELQPDEGTPLWKLILKQFDDLLVKILIVAALVDLAIAIFSGEWGLGALVEPGVIALILVANATVGVLTETNAEKAIEELKAYEAETATVLRNGRLMVVSAPELVPGDIVEVAVGAKVPADLRVAELMSSTLRCDQSILTGESGSVEKGVPACPALKPVYQDMQCIMFSGTVVTAGRARAIVIATGAATALGKIREAMASSPEELTPLRKKLDDFGKLLSKVIAVICVLVWVINIPHFGDHLHGGWLQGALYYFKIAVALAVAAIPEGLPAVVTTCLALGTRKMAKQHAIVRTLPSVETLGCTTVICSDKTGTLTTNMMSVAKVAFLQSASGGLGEFSVTGNSYAPEGEIFDESGSKVARPADHPTLLTASICCALCNDSQLFYMADKGAYERVGEATEVALRVLCEKVGLQGYSAMPSALASLTPQHRVTYCNDYWQQEYLRTSTLEFTRDRKLMSVVATRGGHSVLFVKGAPEAVLARCSTVMANEGGGSIPLTAALREEILALVTSYGSSAALRCLCLACKPMPEGYTQARPEDESELMWLAAVGMHDPPRLEVRAAIESCRAAGIRVVVLTGDNQATAVSICRQVGALEVQAGASEAGRVMTGQEFDGLVGMTQEEAVRRLSVLARVEPAHKTKLVGLLRSQGQVVAMTGDGVNDAPALKHADIGIAMGSGTAVAKHAADMVLADDNFATIVAAVAEGRAIYANTKQFIRYMVSSNIGEVVAIFTAALLGLPEVLNPVQLLWVNLVTDGLPATALGFNRPDPDIMCGPPRRMTDGIVNRWLLVRYLIVGIYVGAATVAGSAWWYIWYQQGPQITWKGLQSSASCREGAHHYSCQVFLDARPNTISMSVLVTVEMFNALNALSENVSLFVLPPWSNFWLLGAIALSMTLHCTILYVAPLARIFSVTALSWPEWQAVLLLSIPVVALDELLKMISRNPRRWPASVLLCNQFRRDKLRLPTHNTRTLA